VILERPDVGIPDSRSNQLASPKGLSCEWADVFSDQVVAAAMIDGIVHHADVITLNGSGYRLKNNQIETLPPARAENQAH